MEVIAFVLLAPGGPVSEAELRHHASQRLAPYKVPAQIVIMDALPASSTGKILKSRLTDLAVQLGDTAMAGK